MQRLRQWFRDQAAGAQRAVFLEDALLHGRFAAYAYYRMRFYIGRSLVAAGLHITEVLFLSLIFTPRLLTGALLVRTATGFAINWWWGALEVMRADIRQRRRNRKSYQIADGLAQWLGAALAGALLVLTSFGAWLAFDLLVAGQPFDVFHLYVLGNGVRLACSLFVRTFHSGVYAVRRVYRPMWSLIIVDLSGFCGAILLWPWLGPWSVPTMLLATVVMSSILNLYFTASVYRSVALFRGPIRWRRPTLPFLRKWLANPRFFAGGSAYALTRVDSILLLALFSRIDRENTNYDLFLLFYIIGPFVRACSEWAQLYYFDLKRLELDAFANLKRAFDRRLRALSGLAALVCWMLAVVCGTLFLSKNLGILYLVLAVLFLVRSRLAYLQIRAFTEDRLADMLASGLIILVGGLACRALSPSGVVRVEIFILFLACALFLLRGNPSAVRALGSDSDILPPLDWLGRLKADGNPSRVRTLKLAPRTNDSAVAHLAGYIARRVRKSGLVTLLGRKRIVWWEREPAQGNRSDDWIWRRGAGMIESLRSTPWEKTGIDALSRAENGGLLGRVSRLEYADAPVERQLDAIKESFRAMFPEATAFELSANASEGLDSFPSAARREIMYGLVRYSKNWFRVLSSGQYDIVALLHQGDVRLVFIVDKAVDKRLRRTWRDTINALNLGLALGPPTTRRP